MTNELEHEKSMNLRVILGIESISPPSLFLSLTDVPRNIRIEESGRGALGEEHPLDTVLLLKRFASDRDLSQDPLPLSVQLFDDMFSAGYLFPMRELWRNTPAWSRTSKYNPRIHWYASSTSTWRRLVLCPRGRDRWMRLLERSGLFTSRLQRFCCESSRLIQQPDRLDFCWACAKTHHQRNWWLCHGWGGSNQTTCT